MDKEIIPANYKAILEQIKQSIAQSQVKAAMAANNEMLWLYWQIGNEMAEISQPPVAFLQGIENKLLDS